MPFYTCVTDVTGNSIIAREKIAHGDIKGNLSHPSHLSQGENEVKIDDEDRQHEIAPPPDLLPRVLAQWPDMARYAATARIEKLYHAAGWCWCVAVDVQPTDEAARRE